jgi:hypothetical protein
LNRSESRLSKRTPPEENPNEPNPGITPADGAVIVHSESLSYVLRGVTRLLVRFAPSVGDGGTYVGVDPLDLGGNDILALLNDVTLEARNILSAAMIPRPPAGRYRIARGLVTFAVSQGVADWYTAICLMDPTGNNNVQAGYYQILEYFQIAFQMVLESNLAEGAFEMVRDTPEGYPGSFVVILTFFVQVICRRRNQ